MINTLACYFSILSYIKTLNKRPVKRCDTCIVISPNAVILYISTHGMPLVQSNYLVGTNCYIIGCKHVWSSPLPSVGAPGRDPCSCFNCLGICVLPPSTSNRFPVDLALDGPTQPFSYYVAGLIRCQLKRSALWERR